MDESAETCAKGFAQLREKLPNDALVAFHSARLGRGETGTIIPLEEK
jgi:hypothetical protein